MLTFIVFIISLTLIVFLFIMKGLEIYHGRKFFLEDFFLECDAWILKNLQQTKFWWSQVNFKNTRLIFSWIIVNIRKFIIKIKKRFDNKPSGFFIKKEQCSNINLNSRGTVSFFLKNVSEHKKQLREKKNIKSVE